jgi:hypothetical protein
MNISLIQRFEKKKQERQLKRSALQEKWNSNRAAKGKSTVGGPMSGLKATLQAKMESSGAGDGEKKMMFQHGQNVRTPSLHPLPPHPYLALQHPLFGAPAPAPTTSLFGAPAPAPTTSLFGAPAPAPTTERSTRK